MFALAYTLYYLTNHYPVIEPKLLPMTMIDRVTPFLPYTVLIYISEYIYFIFVYFSLRNYDNINRYLYSFFLLQSVSCFVFAVYPTIYPRELFPISQELPFWLQGVWGWLRTQDAPTNCFPSLHVSSVYLSALAFRTDGPDHQGKDLASKIKYWIFMSWGTLIALSTLTTKQHYLADIMSGLTLSLAFHWWFHRKQAYSRTAFAQASVAS